MFLNQSQNIHIIHILVGIPPIDGNFVDSLLLLYILRFANIAVNNNDKYR
jgi:hypothetical protein